QALELRPKAGARHAQPHQDMAKNNERENRNERTQHGIGAKGHTDSLSWWRQPARSAGQIIVAQAAPYYAIAQRQKKTLITHETQSPTLNPVISTGASLRPQWRDPSPPPLLMWHENRINWYSRNYLIWRLLYQR